MSQPCRLKLLFEFTILFAASSQIYTKCVGYVGNLGFTAASERLNISKALASKYIGEVERHLNARLFHRSTRKLAKPITSAHYPYLKNLRN